MSASTTGPSRRSRCPTSVSVLKLADFQNDNAMQKDLLLNAPTFKLRGSVQVDDLGIENAFARVDGRYHNALRVRVGLLEQHGAARRQGPESHRRRRHASATGCRELGLTMSGNGLEPARQHDAGRPRCPDAAPLRVAASRVRPRRPALLRLARVQS